ncbi:MAG: chromosome segregation protein SMC [Pseudomonadota bacterium]
MRLSKIKLAGFKTFVDPTTISFPSNLLGVVGPNGCGKSNIIDAVRWVMGESSAKHLRGDSMADVIFNGSSARKPVGNASIELVFDNSDGTIAGQYAGYNEISIKRVVSRDGTSVYYLNNARCRRKDITGVFLGTGLGPRSYSIIEQGMISRLVEAKPEELRVYLEEAAGISKFKERRRETENRIRHTRENLDRLDDLRDEVEKQLKHLQRQAATAKRYQEYKQQERQLTAELLALRISDLDDQSGSEDRILAERENGLEAAIAEQRAVEAAIEEARRDHQAASDQFNEIQGRFYRVGAEIARIEQAIQHGRELRQQQEQDQKDIKVELAELEGHEARDQEQLKEISSALSSLLPELSAAQETAAKTHGAYKTAEAALEQWRHQWQVFSDRSSEAHRVVHVEKTRIEHINEQMRRLSHAQDRLQGKRSELSVQDLEQAVQALHGQQSSATEKAKVLNAEHDALTQQVKELRQRDVGLTQRLDQYRSGQQQLKGRLASLMALQQAALGKDSEELSKWIESNGLSHNPRLAQTLKVSEGWERAVETVLGPYLEAICVDRVDAVLTDLAQLDKGSVGFVEKAAHPYPALTGSLLEKVDSPMSLAPMMASVFTADSVAQAMAQRVNLEPGQSIITREGLWLGKNWLRVSRAVDPHSGVLRREQEVQKLKQQYQQMSAEQRRVEEQHQRVRDDLKRLESGREQKLADLDGARGALSDLNAQLGSRKSEIDHMSRHAGSLETEASEIAEQMEQQRTALRAAQVALRQAEAATNDFSEQKTELETERDVRVRELEQTRTAAEADQTKTQDLKIHVESRRSAETSIKESLSRVQTQASRLKTRLQELSELLAQGESPLLDLKTELDAQLALNLEVKEELGGARLKMDEADSLVREREQSRVDKEQKVQEARELVETVRLAVRELKVRKENLMEQFVATGFHLASTIDGLTEEASIEEWDEQLTKLQNRINRLGAINLAAIDEFKEQSERKEYLDAQNEDLVRALETLESAIAKIDRETRTRFKETFDQVNDQFKRLFPRLFGGGHAYLDLQGDDLLSAGVTVMARPPGKRNSTIHLLSGGEKALTAVALVFSIFELNPSPFCMLDEVDAPLDDSNVVRFCDIVREMSSRVQFVVITHNKITMELAHQLTGITMNEPGVSRLVAVDIDEAVEMVAM